MEESLPPLSDPSPVERLAAIAEAIRKLTEEQSRILASSESESVKAFLELSEESK
jgi:hypothetical protein